MLAMHAISMYNVICIFLVVDQVRSCDPTMAPEDQLDVMVGVSLIDRFANGVVF